MPQSVLAATATTTAAAGVGLAQGGPDGALTDVTPQQGLS